MISRAFMLIGFMLVAGGVRAADIDAGKADIKQDVLNELPYWIENAARGDLAPSYRGGAVTVTLAELRVSTGVTVPPAVPSVAPTVSNQILAMPTGAIGTVQSLLTSGNAASVVVGARLQRTRVVGSPGTANGVSTLRFNSLAGPPLRLSIER